MTEQKTGVMIAGIAGASLGTEIMKCLRLAGNYRIYGGDISPYAFGHYTDGFDGTFVIDRKNYLESLLEACHRSDAGYIVAGAEKPLVLLSNVAEQVAAAGIKLASNSRPVIECFTDKKKTFEALAKIGIRVPLTLTVEKPEDLDPMTYPCIVKPATGSGGSSFVFLAENKDEALLYLHYLTNNEKAAIVQEYISEQEGEFTIGVLSLPNRKVVGSVALRRVFDSKLSVLSRGRAGLISTGYSQGLIDDFPEHRAVAERIAAAIGSEGPINIQGRVKDGVLVPFEINPRFSASTYLRAIAGFNEVDVYLRHLQGEAVIEAPPVRPGLYLRSLQELYVRKEDALS